MSGRRRSGTFELGVLTTTKVVSNGALRWVGPFLPTLGRAFGASTGTLTGVMGVSELGGLSTLATGRLLDRGYERRIYLAGLAAVCASSLIALGGTVPTFAVAYLVLIVGHANLVVAGHAWIGHRVPFERRSRAIGMYETSWAASLLFGAPLLALLIRWYGWRGPYVALALAAIVACLAVYLLVSASDDRTIAASIPLDADAGPRAQDPLPRSAWLPMIASAGTAAAGLGLFVVSGAWLDDVYGVSTTGLGIVAAAFGATELVASGAVAAFGDRIGTRRSVAAGLAALAVGVLTMAIADDSRSIAIGGLIVFLAGFEFAFVASLSLVTEAAPLSRGRAIGTSNAIGTIARASAVVASGQLYEAFGIRGSLALASAAASIALVAIIVSGRSTSDVTPPTTVTGR